MSRQGLDLPPGLKRRSTTQATGKAWFDMSLVRWNARELQPVGGWTQLPDMQLNGPVRSILSWRDNTRRRWIAAAALSQIQVYDSFGHDITPGGWTTGNPADLVDGYGVGLYGVGLYGVPGTMDPTFNPLGAPGDTVSLDNWGENLVVCGSADGRLLWWIPNSTFPGAGLVPIPPADPKPTEAPGIVHVVPTSCRAAFVTDERFVVALGANGDPRRVKWSDQERPGAWTEDVTNLCGELQLKSTGIALAARRVPQGTLIFCDDDVHLMAWVGYPYAYGINRVGTGCGAISPSAMIATSARTAWMGQENFWLFEGVPVPLKCDVQDYVFTNINRNTQGRTTGCHNGRYPEFWWFYPDSTGTDPNRYVAWNYQANLWIGGMMARTGCTEPAAYGLPLFGDINGFVYAHENGWLANGAQRGADVYAETGDLQLGEGDVATCVRAIIPDWVNPEQVQIRVFGQWEPEDQMEDYGVFPLERTDGIIDALFEARAIRLRIEGVNQPMAGQARNWTLGRLRLDVAPGAGR